jgi:hypothetical protein
MHALCTLRPARPRGSETGVPAGRSVGLVLVCSSITQRSEAISHVQPALQRGPPNWMCRPKTNESYSMSRVVEVSTWGDEPLRRRRSQADEQRHRDCDQREPASEDA